MIIKTDPSQLLSYLEDSSGLKGTGVEKVYIPESYQDVVEVVFEANRNHELITISGGGTGTTGGRIALKGSVLSLEKLNSIIEINTSAENPYVIVQAGATIAKINEAVEKVGFFYPPDATETNGFIGGNIATNASGARTYKYGSTRDYIQGIKIVLPTGEALEIPRGKYVAKDRPKYIYPDIKNAAGYYSKENMDLIDLFIGSEGTLGIIVEAKLKLLKKVGHVFACFAFFNKLQDSLQFVKDIKVENRALAIEFFDKNALELLKTKYANIPTDKEAVVFYEEEITALNENTCLDTLAALLEKNKVSLDEVWIADNPKKEKELKEIRHGIPSLVNEIVSKSGFPKAGTDIAVPENNFIEMFEYYQTELNKSGMQHLIFGHIGDSHLHVNMLPKNQAEYELVKEIYMSFVDKALSLGGTVSAEHGIGKLKHRFLEKMYGKAGIEEMKRIKKIYDPRMILNIGNIFE